VSFFATQNIVGIDMDQYSANKTIYTKVLQSAVIASCHTTSQLVVRDWLVTGVATTSNDVSKEAVIAAGERGGGKSTRRVTSASQVTISYTIISFTPSDSFSVLSTNLKNSIASGSFDTLLSSYAQALGASALVGATSSEILVTNKLNTDASDSSPSNNLLVAQSLVIGLVILGCCLFSCTVAYARVLARYMLREKEVSRNGGFQELVDAEGDEERGELSIPQNADIDDQDEEDNEMVDVYISHAHGQDGASRDAHTRVSKINDLLIARGLSTRFDDQRNLDPRQRPRGMNRKIVCGIQKAKVVIVFVSEEYRKCVNGAGFSGTKDIVRYGELYK